MTTLASPAIGENEARPAGRLIGWVDDVTERIGDRLNPILVKEARQTLKSRQFIVTFSLLLLGSWGWTVVAIALMMPRMYYTPTGQQLLIGYYLVLAVPMLLVVPLAAHRSLASEVDDGTLDLLSVTNLSPLQIITGKLASAALQMMLYFVALIPCVAFSYVLRGVDLMTIGAMLGTTAGVATLLTVAGLFLAALPQNRAGQFVMMVVMLILIAIAEFGFGSVAIGLIVDGVGGSLGQWVYGIVAIVTYTVTLSVILVIAAAAQLSPPSENRSTPLRRAILVHQTAMIGVLAYAVLALDTSYWSILPCLYYAAAFWLAIGALMVGEAGILTPRIRRDLPATFLGRAVGVWLSPGPATGLVFSVVGFHVFALWMVLLADSAPTFLTPSFALLQHSLILGGYLMLLLSLTRGVMKLIRIRLNTHPSVAVAVLVIIAALAAIVPYSLALHYHEYQMFSWSRWQITNWAWTLGELGNDALPDDAAYWIFGIGAAAFAVNLVLSGPMVLPQRLKTPERVLAEQRREAEGVDADSPADPLAV